MERVCKQVGAEKLTVEAKKDRKPRSPGLSANAGVALTNRLTAALQQADRPLQVSELLEAAGYQQGHKPVGPARFRLQKWTRMGLVTVSVERVPRPRIEVVQPQPPHPAPPGFHWSVYGRKAGRWSLVKDRARKAGNPPRPPKGKPAAPLTMVKVVRYRWAGVKLADLMRQPLRKAR